MNLTQRRDLAVLSILTLAIGLWGIWRIHAHYLFFDSAGAIQDSLLLLDQGFIKAFNKGGNAHMWLINVGNLLAIPWWALTDQLQYVFNYPGDAGTMVRDPGLNQARNQVTIIGRFMSVIAATVTVAIIYRLADRLYGRRAGWLAALITLLSLGFITTAKMATEDIPVTAAIMGTIWLTVLAVDRADRQYLTYAALALGLAGSFKATAVMAVLPFTMGAYWVLRDTGADWRGGLKDYVSLGAVAFLTYVVTTPSMLRYSALWLGQMSMLTGQSLSGSTYQLTDHRWLMAGVQLSVAMSGPLFVVAITASVVGLVRETRESWHQIKQRNRLTTDGRARWLLVLMLAAMGVFVAVLNSPQFFRLVPMIPLVAVMTAGVVTRLEPVAVRRVLQAGLAVALIFAAVNTGLGVYHWNTVREDAESGLNGLPENASVAYLSQEMYLPEKPDHLEFRKYRDNYKQGRNASAALTQFSNYCSDYIIIAHNHYHRFYRDPTVFPEVNAVIRPVVSLDGYRVVAHYGAPIPHRNNEAFWWEEAWTIRKYPYVNSVGNSPITIVQPTNDPTEKCKPTPGLDAI